MSTQHTVPSEIASLVQSLRQQVNESRRPQPTKGRSKPSSQTVTQENGLHSNLLSLLELIEQIEKPNTNQPGGNPHSTESPAVRVAGPILDEFLAALDGGLAQWQSKITLAYSQNASQELGDHLTQVKCLNESLEAREGRLDSQRQQLEQSLTKLLQREARTSRQRAAIAQALRAQKAEMLLELELQRQEQIGHIRQELLLEIGSTQSANQDELESVRCQLAGAHKRLQEMEGSQATQADENGKLLRELEEQLALANSQLETFRQRQHSHPETPLLLQDQADTIATLKKQLVTAEQQLHELLDQNSDLAAQVAKQQVLSSGSTPHISFQQESLSWEERKKLIMQQLEDEIDTSSNVASSDEQVERHLGIEQLLLTTQTEIEKRDREIAELQAIIEQQSDTRQGVAIGAAAFAQAFDNDEMIQQERAKLKDIQREWEEKLRQAEVDVSLERAKLARERLQLEQELHNTQRLKEEGAQEPDKAKKRKWLEHLGLRDENRGGR